MDRRGSTRQIRQKYIQRFPGKPTAPPLCSFFPHTMTVSGDFLPISDQCEVRRDLRVHVDGERGVWLDERCLGLG